jgi:transcriptional regulator with XRE-family HTH domain
MVNVSSIPMYFPPLTSSGTERKAVLASTYVDDGECFPGPDGRALWIELAVSAHDPTLEWPVPTEVRAALRGLRAALGLSQIAMAERLAIGRGTLERWEAGSMRPLRGDTLRLLSQVRPLVANQIAAGQVIGLAACHVLPQLTRPAGTYSREWIRGCLVSASADHSDMTEALLVALIHARILVEVEPENASDNAEFIAAAGVATLDRQLQDWDPAVTAIAQGLSEKDLRLWMDLGKRLLRQGR